MSAALEAVMREVWGVEQARYASFEFRRRPGRAWCDVVAWRVHGDVCRYAQVSVTDFDLAREPYMSSIVSVFDHAIAETLALLPPLTTSEALEAGERRCCLRREVAP